MHLVPCQALKLDRFERCAKCLSSPACERVSPTWQRLQNRQDALDDWADLCRRQHMTSRTATAHLRNLKNCLRAEVRSENSITRACTIYPEPAHRDPPPFSQGPRRCKRLARPKIARCPEDRVGQVGRFCFLAPERGTPARPIPAGGVCPTQLSRPCRDRGRQRPGGRTRAFSV